jgi:hypothetical protein
MSRPYPTAQDLMVLHTLRCIGVSGLPRVADAAGLPVSDVESDLIDLAVAGLVTRTAGEFGGWGVTDAGRAADARRIADELAAAGARPTVERAYDGFLVLNPELLDLCTAWQLRSVDGVMTTNDHRDAGYDSRVLDRLGDLDRRTEAVCAEVSAVLPRFHRYRLRLADALARARDGAGEYVADGMESYHAVWFQLHEDLLATLGMPRT